MKAKKILFVGGPSDGLRREDPFNGHHVVYTINPAYLTASHSIDPADVDNNVAISTTTYTRKQFRTNKGTTLEAFFHSSISDPMEALLKGYRYHRNPRRFRKVKNPPRYMVTNAGYVKVT